MNSYLLANQSYCIPLLVPPRVATHLDTLRFNLGRKLGQVRSHGTFSQGRRDHNSADPLAFRIDQSWYNVRLQALQKRDDFAKCQFFFQ